MQPSRAAAAARARSLALPRQLCTWTLRLMSGVWVATLVALERVAELQNEQQERSVRF